MKLLKVTVLVLGLVLLSACSTIVPVESPSLASADPQVIACNQYYAQLSDLIHQYGINDAQTNAISGSPYLHTDRFLTGIIPLLKQNQQRRLWLTLTARLALQTHTLAIQNLPDSGITKLNAASSTISADSPRDRLAVCSRSLLQHTLNSPASWPHILDNAKTPDEYRTWKRAIGLYPLVSYPIALGINKWHTKSAATLQTPVAQLPVSGTLVRYSAETQAQFAGYDEVEAALRASRQNALALPLPDDNNLRRLFATFAPVYEVDTLVSDDKIAAPQWSGQEQYADTDITRPSVYTLTSHTVFHGEILLQLIYVVWFPSRPCTSSLDTLCGHLDGITWRVTLGNDGHPLIYDSIHNCGCYHTFFPTRQLQAVPPPPITVDSRASLDERAFVPIPAPSLKPGQQLVIRIAQRTHHIESLYLDNHSSNDDVVLAWTDYDTLRSLPYPGPHHNHKSLFTQSGLVDGTQRKERWLFWPLGVPSAGAMRQWGNHATAFIGRRHFDEPYLLERDFVPANP